MEVINRVGTINFVDYTGAFEMTIPKNDNYPNANVLVCGMVNE